MIDAIIAEVMELQDQENTTLPLLEKQMREVENGIENMLNAIQMGILTSSTKERLEALEGQRKELQAPHCRGTAGKTEDERRIRPVLAAPFP